MDKWSISCIDREWDMTSDSNQDCMEGEYMLRLQLKQGQDNDVLGKHPSSTDI